MSTLSDKALTWLRDFGVNVDHTTTYDQALHMLLDRMRELEEESEELKEDIDRLEALMA